MKSNLAEIELKPYAVIVWLRPGVEICVFIKAYNEHDAMEEHSRRGWEGKAMNAFPVLSPGNSKFDYLTKTGAHAPVIPITKGVKNG